MVFRDLKTIPSNITNYCNYYLRYKKNSIVLFLINVFKQVIDKIKSESQQEEIEQLNKIAFEIKNYPRISVNEKKLFLVNAISILNHKYPYLQIEIALTITHINIF